MKYTHLDIVNSINNRKEGNNTLSWIEKYGIYLCNTSKNIAGSVLVLSIENDDNLSVYDCYFKSKNERTKFCVNKAISASFAEISSLLKNVKCFERNTQQYWNECFCKGQFDQIVTDKKDTLQRPETKASSDPSVDLTMSDFLSDLEKLVKEAIEKFDQTANVWNKYDRIYIASADGRNTYPLVLPLKYTLYNLFETDSKKIWGETFRVKDKEGKSIIKPLSSYNYDWKACQQYFHTGALSRAIGLNVSLELTMNDLMKTDGIRVTFPLETGDDGSYTLPATPVLKECSSDNTKDNTKKISLGGVELNWADLYENVQWDYKVGNHAFKHIKLSICADGCQRLYLMDGEKVLTVISSNGSTVEVENCLKVSNAEPATVVEESADETRESEDNTGTNISNNLKYLKIRGKIDEAINTVLFTLRCKAYDYIKSNYTTSVGLCYEDWVNSTNHQGKSYPDELKNNWNRHKEQFGEKLRNELHIDIEYDWRTYDDPDFPDIATAMLDWGTFYVFFDKNWEGLANAWCKNERDLKQMMIHINKVKPLRNVTGHGLVGVIRKDIENLFDQLYQLSQILKMFRDRTADMKNLRKRLFHIQKELSSLIVIE